MDDTSADIGSDFDLTQFIRELHQDLKDHRAGKITTLELQARAETAKQCFNGLRMIVQAQRFLASRARPIPAIQTEDSP